MAKEWILNIATNRWGLNKKNSVGPVSQWIRQCSPKTMDNWREFYYDKLADFLTDKEINLSPQEYLKDLGRKLYVKITEVIEAEIENITEQDCIEYISMLVINRTYDGYLTEIKTIYGKLQNELGVKINPAPDEWDILYNIDFYIQIENKYIGLQVKPITYEQTPEIHKWEDWLKKTHKQFEERYNGKVFIVFSTKKDNRKEIYNTEVISEIKNEIRQISEHS